jgi:hypothetical protein
MKATALKMLISMNQMIVHAQNVRLVRSTPPAPDLFIKSCCTTRMPPWHLTFAQAGLRSVNPCGFEVRPKGLRPGLRRTLWRKEEPPQRFFKGLRLPGKTGRHLKIMCSCCKGGNCNYRCRCCAALSLGGDRE